MVCVTATEAPSCDTVLSPLTDSPVIRVPLSLQTQGACLAQELKKLQLPPAFHTILAQQAECLGGCRTGLLQAFPVWTWPMYGRHSSFLIEEMIPQLRLLVRHGAVLLLGTLGSGKDSQIHMFKPNPQCVHVQRRGVGQ